MDLVASQEQSLLTSSRRLQRHVERFRTEKELLKASYTATDAFIAVIEATRVASTASASASEVPPSASADLPARNCSFCGKSERQVERIVAGPDVYICSECVDLCQKIIHDESSSSDR